MKFLQGYKTYIIAAAAVLAAVASFATGELTLVEAVQSALLGVGLGTLRAGVKSDIGF